MPCLSTYQSDYIKKQFIVSKLAKPELPEYDELPEGAVWLDTKINVKEASEKKVSLQKIKEMYKIRMRSVYRTDYTGQSTFDADTTYSSDSPTVNKDSEVSNTVVKRKEITDQMLETCKKLKLSKKLDPVLPPLSGARNVFGYMNPKYFHTEITVYQDEIGINACNTMFGRDLSKSRGFLQKT